MKASLAALVMAGAALMASSLPELPVAEVGAVLLTSVAAAVDTVTLAGPARDVPLLREHLPTVHYCMVLSVITALAFAWAVFHVAYRLPDEHRQMVWLIKASRYRP